MVFQVHDHMQYTKQDLQANISANCQTGVKNYMCQYIIKINEICFFECIQTLIKCKSYSEGRGR